MRLLLLKEEKEAAAKELGNLITLANLYNVLCKKTEFRFITQIRCQRDTGHPCLLLFLL